MTGQFFFTLLNPALALILAPAFLVLWRKRPDQTYLGLLVLTFISTGLAFAINDIVPHFNAPLSRATANVLFLTAVASACIAAMQRVGARIPVTLYLVACSLCAIGFGWFLLVTPSPEARVYIVNATYVVLGATTVWSLYRRQPLSSVDWLFVGLSALLTLLGIARPLAMLFGWLDTNSTGLLRDSVYWATVQAATPILAVALGLAFIGALAVRLLDESSAEANRDFLTGLLNRRGFDRGVQKALAGHHSGERKPALIIVDIDNFKAVNDTFGHAVGDEVIATVAEVLTLHGQADLVARTGGEEFTLFYRADLRSSLLPRAQAITSALATTDPTARLGVTVSMGMHSRHQSESISEMMASADRALYAAKRAGKDRAILAPIPSPLPGTASIHERRTGSRLRAS